MVSVGAEEHLQHVPVAWVQQEWPHGCHATMLVRHR